MQNTSALKGKTGSGYYLRPLSMQNPCCILQVEAFLFLPNFVPKCIWIYQIDIFHIILNCECIKWNQVSDSSCIKIHCYPLIDNWFQCNIFGIFCLKITKVTLLIQLQLHMFAKLIQFSTFLGLFLNQRAVKSTDPL